MASSSATSTNAASMASTVALTSAATVASAPADTVYLTPSAPANVYTLPVAFKFDKGTSNLTYKLHRTPLILHKFGVFESIRLISADFALNIPPGLGTGAGFCFSASPTIPPTIDDILAHPVANFVGGGQYGYTLANFTLPPDSSFGRELKMVNLGNEAPILHIRMLGVETFTGYVRGTLKLACSGVGIIDGIMPVTPKSASAATPVAGSIKDV